MVIDPNGAFGLYVLVSTFFDSDQDNLQPKNLKISKLPSLTLSSRILNVTPENSIGVLYE